MSANHYTLENETDIHTKRHYALENETYMHMKRHYTLKHAWEHLISQVYVFFCNVYEMVHELRRMLTHERSHMFIEIFLLV